MGCWSGSWWVREGAEINREKITPKQTKTITRTRRFKSLLLAYSVR